jgi:hypothetical protein
VSRSSFAPVVVASLAFAAPALAGESAQLARLLADKAPTVVPVRLVLKTEMKYAGNAQDEESRLEMDGTVVDPGGLVMIANTALSPSRLLSLMGQEMEGAEITATPTDIKVVLGPDEKEYTAFLAATDSKVDLAFLQVEGLGDRRLQAVDLQTSVKPAIGDELAVVSRLAKGFDAAPYLELARVVGEITKPRPAWVVGGPAAFGVPAYTLDGKFAGVLTTLESGVAASDGESPFGFSTAMRMLSGGGGMIRPFLLPASAVSSLVQRAREQAAAKIAERAKSD